MPARPEVEISHNREGTRYEARIGGELAGIAAYRIDGRVVAFTHTEVDPAFEGQGVGGALARFALDDVRTLGGLQVLPICPFITTWIERHPDYAALVTAAPPDPADDPTPVG